jgi:hypothetical protein
VKRKSKQITMTVRKNRKQSPMRILSMVSTSTVAAFPARRYGAGGEL